MLWVFGVIIPLATVVFEAVAHIAAEVHRDPIPTWLHFIVLLAVPTWYMATDFILNRSGTGRRWTTAALIGNGFALTVSVFYFIFFLPIMPLAVIAIIFVGMGLLALTPLWCMIAGFCQLLALHRRREDDGLTPRRAVLLTLSGVLLAGLLLGLPEVHQYVIGRGVEMAFSDDRAVRTEGLRRLRFLYAQDEILRRCYYAGGGSTQRPLLDISWRGGFWGESRGPAGSPELAQRYRGLYYRLTGRAFNSVPPPQRGGVSLGGRSRSDILRDEWDDDWDRERLADGELGGSAVGGRVKGLMLLSSTIDGVIETAPDGGAGPAVGYVEWVLEFRNDTRLQREARCQVLLPAGGVASRLTLWVNGIEQPAAYGRRNQVTQAYRQVAVRERRDPALLNYVGPDRVLLQCFPIPPGGTIKTKVGITAPLLFRDGQAHLQLPSISERNFSIPDGFRHSVWVESKAAVRSSCRALISSQSSKGHEMHGAMRHDQLQDPAEGVLSIDAAADRTVRYRARLGDLRAEMTLSPSSGLHEAGDFFLVIDGSAGMDGLVGSLDWPAVMKSMPAGSRINVVLAGDLPVRWGHGWAASADAGEKLKDWLADQEFVGGCSPNEALEMALDESAQHGGRVLWLHAPLPVELDSAEGLKQRLRRRTSAGDCQLVAVQVAPGPHRLVESLGDVRGFERVPVLTSLQQTLQHAVRAAADPRRTYQIVTTMPSDAVATTQATQADESTDHIVRLAVFDYVMEAWKAQRAGDSTAQMAIKAQLVTPLSGAVVLETKEQYARNDLSPSAAESQPVVPEPTTMVLLSASLVALLARRPRQHAGFRTKSRRKV